MTMEKLQLFETHPQVKPKGKPSKRNVLPKNPEKEKRGRFPSWLHRKLPKGGVLWKTGQLLKEHRLNTVCEEAKCPNRLECYGRQTATFLAMGRECSRSCGFCDIAFSKTPPPLEEDEPLRIASSVQKLGLKHVVITMVTRDDLEDGGADHIAAIIRETRQVNPGVTIEVLTSDFGGNHSSWETILNMSPDVFNHNIETIRSLTPRVRHRATYDRTLELLQFARASKKSKFVKSGLMVGLGETDAQVEETLNDLKEIGCQVVTIGQYLQPNLRKLRVKKFISPETFKKYEEYGLSIGIPHMYCAPFMRSSYNADLLKLSDA